MWNSEWIVPGGIMILALAVMWWPLARGARQTRGYRLLFVGSSPGVLTVIGELDERDDLGWHVLGVVDNLRDGELPEAGPWLGPVSELPEIIAATSPTHIVLGRGTKRWRSVEPTLVDARLAGIVVEELSETLERATGKLPIERLSPRTLALSRGFKHSDIVGADTTQRLSRVFSAVTAAVGLVITSPLLVLIAIAIKLESRGPVLFTQDRLGMGGGSFRLYKFRTMRETEARLSEWVSDNTHRITRVGRWLRRFRLDELPQLVNVLAGDMNLVGPRPHPSCNGPLFLARIPHYRLRASVRPGITGWAQIKYGYANGLEEETEKMRYDLYYIKHRSFVFDLRILVSTFTVLLFDRHNHERVRQTPSTQPVVWTGRWPVAQGEGVSR